MSNKVLEYKRRILRQVSDSPEKWEVIFGGEVFSFNSLKQAKHWVDFISQYTLSFDSWSTH